MKEEEVGSVLVVLVVGFLVLLWVFGDSLLWRTKAYREFREKVHELSTLQITSIKGSKAKNWTLGKINGRRVPEIFVTDSPLVDTMTIGQCFGVLFIRQHAFGDEIAAVKGSAALLLGVAACGLGYILATDAAAGQEMQSATWTEMPWVAARLVVTHDLVLWLEFLALVTSIIYLMHSARFLDRVNRIVAGLKDA